MKRKTSFVLHLVLLATLFELQAHVQVSATYQQDGHHVQHDANNGAQIELDLERQSVATTTSSVRSKFKLPKMIDFARFKTLFGKLYKSRLEEMRRLKLFLVRSYEAFISAVKYKYGKSGYFLSVNPRTDWTKEELEASRNKIPMPSKFATSALKVIDIDEIDSDTQLYPTKRHRAKRSSGKDDESEPEVIDYKGKPEYSALDYNRIARGQENDYSKIARKGKHLVMKPEEMMEKPFNERIKSPDASRLDNSSEILEDVIWVDHRQSKCIGPVLSQGRCGGCYAFATTSFFEWAHCNETGKFVKFSEQYIIDCGPRIEELSGCGGGVMPYVGEFAHNFGFELASTYPYRGRDDLCPYAATSELANMGFVRAKLDHLISIPYEYIENFLELYPILVNIDEGGDFIFYGGGVYDGRSCRPEAANHSVMLIGHGREDGEEYWLIRNSHSSMWGENGYMKLNKNSDCIFPRDGFAFSSANGMQVKLQWARNQNLREPVRKPGVEWMP